MTNNPTKFLLGSGKKSWHILECDQRNVESVAKTDEPRSLHGRVDIKNAGKNDPRVPVSESEQIVAALKKQGTPVWYLMGKDEGHGFRKKANQDFQFYATVEFLKEYLLK